MAKNSEQNGETGHGLKFALDKITGREIRDLNKALRAGDVDAIAGIYARIITECPKEWGAPDDPETYVGLPFYTILTDEIVIEMGQAGKNARAS